MRNLLHLPRRRALLLYAFADILCLGLGMGVPIFCIALGVPVGWYLGRRLAANSLRLDLLLDKMFFWAAVTSALTFVCMLVLWGPQALKLRATEAELANFGIPMILYRPRASFVGWLLLMIFVSPFLQFLCTLFGAQLGVRWHMKALRREGDPA
ncbi:MAG: hypothetical protein H5U38_15540 [Calditrichaeota bacterium]|nr:hypothetical protein [Calditrichota bacterium]